MSIAATTQTSYTHTQSPVSQGSYAIALDTETTGLDANVNHVIEVALKIIDVTSGKLMGSYESVVKLSDQEWAAADPRALAVNGFTLEMMQKEGKPWEQVAAEITQVFQEAHLMPGVDFFLCQNPTFDRPFFHQILPQEKHTQLRLPYHWLDLASMNFGIEQRKITQGEIEPYSIRKGKDAIAEKHGIEPEEKPHRAMNGVDHMMKIYEKIIGYANQAPANSH